MPAQVYHGHRLEYTRIKYNTHTMVMEHVYANELYTYTTSYIQQCRRFYKLNHELLNNSTTHKEGLRTVCNKLIIHTTGDLQI